MLEVEVLVVELIAVDRDAPGAIALDEVPALAHEALDDPMERAPLVADGLACLPELARAHLPEVVRSAWNDVREELRAHKRALSRCTAQLCSHAGASQEVVFAGRRDRSRARIAAHLHLDTASAVSAY